MNITASNKSRTFAGSGAATPDYNVNIGGGGDPIDGR